VSFEKRIRDERKFSSIEELRAQIERDIISLNA
jgi:FAD synthase